MATPLKTLETDLAGFFDTVKPAGEPVVLKGLARDWPAVAQARKSPQDLAAYIAGFWSGVPAPWFEGDVAMDGRFFYNDAMDGFNYAIRRGPLPSLIDRLMAGIDDPQSPYIYAGSLSVPVYVPGFAADNSLRDAIAAPTVAESIWIGNRTVTAPHYDNTENIAVCVGGRRRFTLFSIEQYANLYPGPPDFTPAGQTISLVDTRHPDLERFPRYAEAGAAARVAELEPGDAIYIPTLWWHGVESLTGFGVLVNYWWRDVPDAFASPADTILHALLSLKHLPPEQRARWKTVFDRLIFENGADEAWPYTVRSVFKGELTPDKIAKVRAFLAQNLSR